MSDLVVAVGLVLAIEGIVFAAFPAATREALAAAAATPDWILRRTGIVAAVIGVAIVWLIRG